MKRVTRLISILLAVVFLFGGIAPMTLALACDSCGDEDCGGDCLAEFCEHCGDEYCQGECLECEYCGEEDCQGECEHCEFCGKEDCLAECLECEYCGDDECPGKWDVTFRFGNGQKGKIGSKKKVTISGTPGKSFKPAKTPTLKGHAFKGWFTKAKGGKKLSKTAKAPKNNTTYYAQWAKKK